MKKIAAVLLVLVALGVGLIPVFTTRTAESAFLHPNDPESQDSLRKAIQWKMNLYLFTDARRIAEKAAIWFPESKNIDFFIYSAALCAEKDKVYSASIHWLSRFVELFPDHPWTPQATAKLEKLKALHGAN